MIFKLWHYLNHIRKRDYLPKLPIGYVTEYDEKQLDDNERLILSAARARDRVQSEHYLEMKKTTRVIDIDGLWQQKPRPRKRQRFRNWVLRMLGETPYDIPISQHFREIERKQQQHYTPNLWN